MNQPATIERVIESEGRKLAFFSNGWFVQETRFVGFAVVDASNKCAGVYDTEYEARYLAARGLYKTNPSN